MERTWTWVAAMAAMLTMTGAQAGAQEMSDDATAQGEAATQVVQAAEPAGFDAEVLRSSYGLRDFSGPRLGLMYAGGSPEMRRRFRDRGFGDMVSLFGWQFERTVVPVAGGPQLVTEAIPMLGGVEYGKILPSITFSAGLRLRSGFEFGMGPSFTPINSHGGASTGLVLAVGKSIEYDGLNLPINLGASINPKGTMLSVTLGYALRRN